MTPRDIEQAQEEFVQAARNAIDSGFDGVEIHGANGYLVEQFIHPHTNRRSDDYGGNMEKRCRFVLEIAAKVCDAIGKDRVGVRLSPYGTFNDMPHYPEIDETYSWLAGQLNSTGICYIHLCDKSGMGGPAIPEPLKKGIRDRFGGSLILCGGYDRITAERVIESGLTDLVAFGRPFISNPDLVARMRNDWPLAEPDMDTFYTPGEKGYVDYPEYGASAD